MRHISYGEAQVATDHRVADLLLEYATALARSNSADTVTIPGRVGGGAVEPVDILVGPASQLTTWGDDEPFGGEVDASVADLEHRIRSLTAVIATSDGLDGPEGIDEFDELA
jgi:hypothetical protein